MGGNAAAKILARGVGGQRLDKLCHFCRAQLAVACALFYLPVALAGAAVDNRYETIGYDDCVLARLWASLRYDCLLYDGHC